MQYSLSKSKYCQGVQCPKMLWLKEHAKDQYDASCMNESILESGHEVGDLAKGLFGDYVEVPYGKPGEMAAATTPLMEQKIPVIAEASFSANGCFCSVDILKRLGDKQVAIYEVKSSTGVKDVHRQDAAYQYYVLTRLGYEVVSCNIVHINNKYVRHGELDIHQFLTIADITEDVKALQKTVCENIDHIRNYMEQTDEPTDGIGMHCFEPYACGFWGYCSRHLPKPNAFDVSGIGDKSAMELYQQGIFSFEELKASDKIRGKKRFQVEFELDAKPPKVDLTNLRTFLAQLSYPMYFFDFESYTPAVPPFDDARPFQQIVCQYSLHYIEYEGGPIHHTDFLVCPDHDPRKELAERMCADIPKDVCVVVYNRGFEQTQIKELAALCPDLSEHLMNIHDHIVDLMVPFQKRWYYCRAMKGSHSIKQVLPALFPDDPDLDYHNLEGIHNGGEALSAFKAMARMTPEELEITRQQLRTYCGLDTFAMIKLVEKLKEICQ